MQTLWQDLKYTLRQLRNAPGFALTAVLTLALGLGATTAMLAIVDSVLIRPVALPHAERLMHLGRIVNGRHEDVLRPNDIKALRANVKAFEGVAAYNDLSAPVTTTAGTRIALRFSVLPGFFDVPGIPARLGRLPSAVDGTTPWAVVSDAFWRDNLHGNPHVIGSQITMEGKPFTVIGVLPASMKFPENASGTLVFTPLVLNENGRDNNNFLGDSEVAVRLRPGATPAVALAEAQAVYSSLAPIEDYERGRLTISKYQDAVTGNIKPSLFALSGACALLLLIACVNSANLQIARAERRVGEISLRAALGATRRRLFQQLATESVVVSFLGAGLGLAFAFVILKQLRAAYGFEFPRFDELAIHPSAFAGCAFLAAFTGVLASLAPAWNAMRIAGSNPLSQSARVTRRSRLSGTLVAVEVALTCTLLITAGLFLRTFRALEQAPLGFDPQHVTEITLMPLNPRQDNGTLKQNSERLLTRLGSLPGVQAAAHSLSFPFSNFTLQATDDFKVVGQPGRKSGSTSVSFLSEGYERTLNIHLLEGRGFLPSDHAGTPAVGLVNQAFARRFLKSGHATSHSIEFTIDSTDGTDNRLLKTPISIIGVLPNQPGSSLGDQADPTVFLSYAQFPVTGSLAHFVFGIAPQFAVRSSLPQASLEHEIRGALKDTAPDMAEMQIGSLESNIAASLTRQRLALRLASGFGLLALLLAAVGIYGVLAYSVAQRTREIGIRMALGSSRAKAMQLVLRQAGVMVVAGLAGGFLGAWPAGRAVKAFLYGVTPLDPLTLFTAAAVLLLVAACAAAVPAYRATQVDPMEALRTE